MLASFAGAGVIALALMVGGAFRSDPGPEAGEAGETGGEASVDVADPGDSAGAGDGSGATGVALSLGEATTTDVQLEAGWTIPERIEGDEGDGAIGGLGQALTAGDATVGAEVAVEAGSTTFVVRSDVVRDLAYRTTTDGGSSGPWRALSIGSDEAPDGLPGEEGAAEAPPAAIPVLLADDVSRLEFIDRAGDDRPFRLILLPAFDGPVDPEFDGPAAPSLGADGAPAILPRSAWTSADWAYDNSSCEGGPEVSDHLQAVVIHHTVNTNDYAPEDVDDILRSILYTHTRINGWCDIGYNFVVDRFGRIWEARTGSIAQATIGGHARGFNTGTLGVALLGQHHAGAWPPAATASPATQDAVRSLVEWRLGAEGVDPHGQTWLRNRSSGAPQRLAGETWHLVPTVLGHRNLGLTSCPGSHGMDVVATLPDRLAAGRDRSLPYRWTGWRPHDHGPALAIVDARGGIRPAGSAEPWSPAPAGTGANGAAVAIGGDVDGGYVLTTTGTLLAYGSAPAVSSPVVSSGAIDLVVRSDRSSGWVLDGTGALRGFGGTADLNPAGGADQPVAAAVADAGRGFVLERSGRLAPVGGLDAGRVVPPGGSPAVDLVIDSAAAGWVLDGNGRLLGFGGRPDRSVVPTAAPVAVVAGLDEPGGWVLDRSGQLWPFGGARYVFPVSTDARAADAVDAVGAGLVFTPGFLSSGDARYVSRLHELFIGRPATAPEIDRTVTALEQGSDRLDLTLALARSDQWAGSALDRMYRDVLGREPDPDGRSYWMGEIGRGLRLEDLGTYFYGSPEYARAAGSDQAYVRRLYEILLRRQPDADGLAYWTSELTSSRARPTDVAAGFYVSIESRRDRAGRLFQQIFGSPPSPERRDALAERLSTIGDVGLAAELAAGSDFYHQAADGP